MGQIRWCAVLRRWALLGWVLLAAWPASATTLYINSTDDAELGTGAYGTLRYCLKALSNQSPAQANRLIVSLGDGLHTINVASPLPAINQPLTIDASTLTGYTDKPLFCVNGTGSSGNCFDASAPLTLTAVCITGFSSGSAVHLTAGSSGSRIVKCFLGVGPDGVTAGPNRYGVTDEGTNTELGGSPAAFGNVISGNTNAGVQLLGSGAALYNNRIGLGADGTTVVPNGTGVLVNSVASGCRIGSASNHNVISGNTDDGVLDCGSGTIIDSNYIGTDDQGTVARPNGTGVRIGHTGTATTCSNNVISGNTDYGVVIAVGGHTLSGNRIGLTATGTAAAAVGNGTAGLYAATNYNTISTNLISGNGNNGVLLTGGHNTFTGNYVGTNSTGSTAVANGTNGVYVSGSYNTIGGSTAAERNVISGNTQAGIVLLSNASGNVINGNYLGLAADGSTALANHTVGILASATGSNQIGSTTASERNVISGNTGNGVTITAGAQTVAGNTIGLIANGTAARGNGGAGIEVQSYGNTINANVIAGNASCGVAVSGMFNQLTGNFIGTNATGTGAVANAASGVTVSGSSNGIGGTTTAARNVISGNTAAGITLQGTAGNNQIRGNYVGLAADGAASLGNHTSGIVAASSASNSIGGTAAGQGNVISGNTSDGVTITAGSHTVAGNLVGLTAAGTAIRTNGGAGLNVQTNGNTISANVVGGNASYGVALSGSSNQLTGNYIGTNATGTGAMPNQSSGLSVTGSSNTIGGTTAAARNVISGNGSNGLELLGSGGSNTIQGNYIGLAADGATALANHASGVLLASSVANTVGGSSGAGNVISGNTGNGVTVTAGSHTISCNTIGLNAAGTAAVANGSNGVEAQAASSTLSDNTISGNGASGVLLTGNQNTVTGNKIGLNAAGTAAVANTTSGVKITGSSSTIGGTTAAARNVISGNLGCGIDLASATTSSQIKGNYIGLAADGATALANGGDAGIRASATGSNQIGGTTSGEGNVISGNTTTGITVIAGTPTIAGNTIGLTAAGTAAAPNGGIGVAVSAGTATLDGNTISGNTSHGLSLTGGMHTVTGNRIGTNAAGTAAVANGSSGVYVSASSCTIGGSTAAARNVISGNTSCGIELRGAAASNQIKGNYLGLSADGTTAIGNATGLKADSSGANQVGGTASGERNVISGNGTYGVDLSAGTLTLVGNYLGTNADGTAALGNGIGLNVQTGSNTISGNVISGNTTFGAVVGGSSNTVTGNCIGTNAAGTAAVANGQVGLAVTGGSQTIGGSTASARNLISGNSVFGVYIGWSVSNVALKGNYIGTDVTGTVAIANRRGVGVRRSTGTVIGGSASGEGNLISGNLAGGVELTDGCQSTVVQGNYLGTNAAGTAALSQGNGILVDSAVSPQVGGAGTGEGNLISGNTGDGLEIDTTSVTGAVVKGNYFGTNAAGTAAVPNRRGILLHNTAGHTIGAPGAGNLISGNTSVGLAVVVDAGASTDSHIIQANKIGTDVTGTTAIANGGGGLWIDAGQSNLVGGTASGAGNLISGNADVGLHLGGTNNTVQGNRIGTNAAGTAALGNVGGVVVTGAGHTIGGTASGAPNLIAGNSGVGLTLTGSATTSATVQGNLIGTDVSGELPVPNQSAGVAVTSGVTGAAIGGTASGAANTVAYNGGAGVAVDSTSSGIAVSANRIHDNGGLGIDLGATGVTVNDASHGSSGANKQHPYPVLTSATLQGSSLIVTGYARAGDTINLYTAAPDSTGFGEPATHLGQFVEGSASDTNAATITYTEPVNGLSQGNDTNASRFRSAVTAPAGLTLGSQLTATATDSGGNTSECSGLVAVAGSATQLSFATQPANAAAGTMLSPAVRVAVCDALGRRVPVGTAVALAVNTPSGGTLGGTTTVTADDGLATFSDLSLTAAGSYTLVATGAGLSQAVSSSFSISAAPAAPANALATVPSTGTAGTATPITVQARDGLGNNWASGGATVVATVTGANAATVTLTDNRNGTYSGSYTPTAAGTDQVAITFAGTTVTGSPFSSVVGTSLASAARTTASVPAGQAGVATTITVTVRDANGNALTVGGNVVGATITGANVATASVTDHGNGTYTLTYTPTTVGTDQIAITLAGVAISGSPYGSEVGFGATSAARSSATVPAGTTGLPTTIAITARDANGNRRTTGGDTVVVTVTGANAATPAVTDGGHGTYTASYTPTAIGTDQVAITVGGVAIGGSPFASQVACGATSADRTTAQVPGGVTGQATQLTVTVRDAQGNARGTGGDTVVVTVTGANAATPAVTDGGYGTYTASYTPTAVGTDQVAVTVGGAAISGSPYTSAVAAATPDAVRSTVTVAPARIGSDGTDAAMLTVTLKDAASRPVLGLPSTARQVTVTGTSTNGTSLSVTDAGTATDASGAYLLTARATAVDRYAVQVTAGGVALSPVTIDALQVLSMHLPAGLACLTVPAQRSDASAEATFGAAGWQLARWQAGNQSFAYRRPGDGADAQFDLTCGRGLWVKLDQARDLRLLGQVTPAEPYELAVPNGWGLAGNPYDSDLRWNLDTIHVIQNGTDLGALGQPSLWGLVRPYVWVYDALTGQHQLVFGTLAGTLDRAPRCSGFWVKGGGDRLSLRLPAPTNARRAAPAQAGPRDWSLTLTATGDGGAAGQVTVGQSSRLPQALEVTRPPQPDDTAAPLLSLITDRGESLAGRLQAPSEALRWDLQAVSRQAGPVTLSWPSLLRQVPRGLLLWLTDGDTNQSVLLNTRGSYRYTAAAAGDRRRFQLTARFGNLDRATITSLTATPSRGRGLGLSLVLTGPAEVQLTVRGLSGRTLRRIDLGAQPAGQVTAAWDGLDESGRPAPAGSYTVEATAQAADGSLSRVSRLAVVR